MTNVKPNGKNKYKENGKTKLIYPNWQPKKYSTAKMREQGKQETLSKTKASVSKHDIVTVILVVRKDTS